MWRFYLTLILLLFHWPMERRANGQSSLFDKIVAGDTQAILQAAGTLSPEDLHNRLKQRAPILSPACQAESIQTTGSDQRFDGLFDFAIDDEGMLHAVFSAGDQHGYQNLYYRVGKDNLWSKPTRIFSQRSLNEHFRRVFIRTADDKTVFVGAILANVKNPEAQQKVVMIARDPKKGWRKPQLKSSLVTDPSTVSAVSAKSRFHMVWQMDRQDGVGLHHAQLQGRTIRIRKFNTGIPAPGQLFVQDGKLFVQFDRYFSRFANGKWLKRKQFANSSRLRITEVSKPMLAAEHLDMRAPLASALKTNIFTGGILNGLRPKWALVLPNIPLPQRANLNFGWTSIKEPAALIARGPHLYLARPGNPATLGSPIFFGEAGSAVYGAKMHLNGNRMRAMWAVVLPSSQVKINYCDVNLKQALWTPVNKAIWMAAAGRGLTASDRTLLAEYLTLIGQRDWQLSKAETALTSFMRAVHAVAQPAQAPHATTMLQRLASTRPQLFLKTLLAYTSRYPTLFKHYAPGEAGHILSAYVGYFAIKPGELYTPPDPKQFDAITATTVLQLAKKYPDLYGDIICVAIENRDPGPEFQKQVGMQNTKPMSKCPTQRVGAKMSASLINLRWIRWLGPTKIKVSSQVFLKGTSFGHLDVLQKSGNQWQSLTSHRDTFSH